MANIREIAVWKNKAGEGEGSNFGWERYQIGSITNASLVEYTPSTFDQEKNDVGNELDKLNDNIKDINIELQGLNSTVEGLNSTINSLGTTYVKKTGANTLTGDLTLKKNAPWIFSQSSTLEAQIGKTIPSSGSVSFGGNKTLDTKNNVVFYTEVQKKSNDDLYKSYVLQRLDSKNQTLKNGFYLHINKDGVKSIEFTGDQGEDAAIWRNGIGAAPKSHASTGTSYGVGNSSNYGHVKVINNLKDTSTSGAALSPNQGKVLNDTLTPIDNLYKNSLMYKSGTANLSDGWTNKITSFTLTSPKDYASTWLVSATLGFENNHTGRRILSIHDADNGSGYGQQEGYQQTNAVMRITSQRIFTVAKNKSITVQLNAYQTSGTTMAGSWSYQYIRLR